MFIENSTVTVTDVVVVSTPDGEWTVPYAITPDGLVPDLTSLPGAVGAEAILALMERGTVISGPLSEGQWNYWWKYYPQFALEVMGSDDMTYGPEKCLKACAHVKGVKRNWETIIDRYWPGVPPDTFAFDHYPE